MRALASFVMRGPGQAVLVAAGFAALSLAVPPLSYLSAAVLALVTLRNGPKDGALVLVAAAAVLAGMGLLSVGVPWVGLSVGLMLWLPVWLLSLTLRASVSLALAFQAAAVLGACVVLGTHIVVAEPVAAWRDLLEGYFAPLLREAGVADVERALAAMAELMTGVAAAALVSSYLVSLLLARWWQAMLYNPGGFQQEFHELRLGQAMAGVTLLVFAAAWLFEGGGARVARDLGSVAIAVYLFQGLAVVHGLVKLLKAHVAWLVGMYVLGVVALPQVSTLISGLGLLDTWVDVRRRVQARRGGAD